MKSLATDEIGLDAALAAAGVEAVETDLAELIVQLAGDTASHILVPAVHYSRGQVRDLFLRTIARGTRALRRPARARRGLRGCTCASASCAPAWASPAPTSASPRPAPSAWSRTRATAACAPRCRRCWSPSWASRRSSRSLEDLELLLRLLPRSATGERMSSYASLLTGVTRRRRAAGVPHRAARQRAPRRAAPTRWGRQALRCIRCSACLNVCPVYARVGGHAYGSIYPGPDRRDPDAAAVGDGGARLAAVRLSALRRLRRGLPGEDRHPVGAAAPAGAGRARAGARAGEGRVRRRGLAVRQPRRFAAAQRLGRVAERPLLRRGLVRRLPGPLARLDARARPAPGRARDVPRVVGRERRA